MRKVKLIFTFLSLSVSVLSAETNPVVQNDTSPASNVSVSSSAYSISVSSSINFPQINIVYPYENMKIPNVSKTFIFGNIKPSTATLKINGENINVYKNGGFISYLPVNEGSFKFQAEVFDGISTATYIRNVYVNEKPKLDVESNASYIKLLYPDENLEVMPGDYLSITAKASPKSYLVYEFNNNEYSMQEYPPGSGYYYGLYKIKENDSGDDIPLILKIKKGLFHSNVKLVSKYKIKVRSNNFVLVTSTDGVILKNAIQGGYTLFLSSGVKLIGTGKYGPMFRVKVGDMILWVSENNVNYLSENFKEPQTETGTIYLKKLDANKTVAQIAIYDKVPYSIYEQENSLLLTLYYTNIHTNWIVYDSSDTFIKNVSFRQRGNNTAEFIFNFDEKNKLWGYDVEYKNNSLNLKFKFKPEMKNNKQKPLEGLKIIIDPGHSPKNFPPFDGAVGPMGSFEYEVNLKIALKLKDKLSNLGATVYMTRYGDEEVPLVLRPIIAKQLDGDMFISIHNNAIPDGEDPFSKPRGFQVYYYHNHSMALAESVHKAFLKNIPLPDEGLRYGDYHVIRTNTYMPAILIENAYLILPEQEEMLNDVVWQDKFAETIKEGIVNFFKEGSK